MLKYFFENTNLTQVVQIRDLLSIKKQRIQYGDFSEPEREIQAAESIFSWIKQYAISNNIEQLANAQYITKLYLQLFCQLSKYFWLLKEREYKESWSTLQNCLDLAFYIGKYSVNRYEVPQIVDLLKCYEGLYPYQVFASTEMVIGKSECSICGNPMNSFDCPHIKGNLYWGEVANERIIEVKELKAIALVRNPMDKRCVMETAADTRSKEEKFQALDGFLQLDIPLLQLFSIETSKVRQSREDIQILGRNEKCFCGSGKKFKRCCGQYLNCEYIHNDVELKGLIHLQTDY